MSDEQLRHFRRRLELERQAVNLRIKTEQEGGAYERQGGEDAEELSAVTERQDQSLRLGDSLSDEFAAIDEALLRIDHGEYGQCDVCGHDIDPRRLEALPTARTCTAHSGRQAGGPTL
ncbi:MAG TPA: TraR/DksA C4-type zinc finger protein [Polyangia bacterium]